MNPADLRSWLAERIGGYLEISPADLPGDEPLSVSGLDSMSMLMLCGEIEDTFGLPMQARNAWEHPTLDALTGYVADRLATQGRAVAGQGSG